MRCATKKRLTLIAIATLLACLAGLLFSFAPDQYPFYPRCFLFATTGLQCPGCGGLRATHQLLHGNLLAAFYLNPLFITLIPFLAGALGTALFRFSTGRSPFAPFKHPLWTWSFLTLVILFTLGRNLLP